MTTGCSKGHSKRSALQPPQEGTHSENGCEWMLSEPAQRVAQGLFIEHLVSTRG